MIGVRATSRTVSNTKINCSNKAAEDLIRTTPYLYIGRKLYLINPYNLSPRLLGLAYLAPISHL